MNKKEYLQSWAERIQQNIWEREIIMDLKKSKDAQDKDLEVLKLNNEKDKEIVDFIAKNNN